jgi:hypothetical protein
VVGWGSRVQTRGKVNVLYKRQKILPKEKILDLNINCVKFSMNCTWQRGFLPLFFKSSCSANCLNLHTYRNQFSPHEVLHNFLLESINMRISTPPIMCARIMFRILCKLFIEGANRESVSPLSLRSWSQCLMTPLSCTWYTSTVCSLAGLLLLA